MAQALIKYETIGIEQIKDIMQGKPASEPASWHSNSNKDTSPKPEKPENVQQPEDKQESRVLR